MRERDRDRQTERERGRHREIYFKILKPKNMSEQINASSVILLKYLLASRRSPNNVRASNNEC